MCYKDNDQKIKNKSPSTFNFSFSVSGEGFAYKISGYSIHIIWVLNVFKWGSIKDSNTISTRLTSRDDLWGLEDGSKDKMTAIIKNAATYKTENI